MQYPDLILSLCLYSSPYQNISVIDIIMSKYSNIIQILVNSHYSRDIHVCNYRISIIYVAAISKFLHKFIFLNVLVNAVECG